MVCIEELIRKDNKNDNKNNLYIDGKIIIKNWQLVIILTKVSFVSDTIGHVLND